MPNSNNQHSISDSTRSKKTSSPKNSSSRSINGVKPANVQANGAVNGKPPGNGSNGAAASLPLTALSQDVDPLVNETVAERVSRERPRSLRMQYRFFRSLIFAFWLFLRLIFWQIYLYRWFPDMVERTNNRRWQKYARQFRKYALSMGGVMIKLGQFASTRADTLPIEVIKELESLQDEVPPVPYDRCKSVIEQELGPVDKRYEWIDHESVASASFGQVYRAKLLKGDRVVIKVQRPGIKGIVYTDLSALMIVARVATRFRFINKRADVVALAEEFGRVLLEEVSYKREAQNAIRFAKMFKKDMGVYVPSVYKEHSTDTVLTMEDVTTIKVNDYSALRAAGISRKAVAKRLMDTYMQQIFEERFFHADPHPGNLFVYPLPVKNEQKYIGKGGRPFYLIFIDFGMTGSLTKEIRQGLVDTLAAVITRDARKLVQAYKGLGFLLPGAEEKRIEEAVKVVFDQVWGLSMTEMASMDFASISEIGKEFNDLLYDMPFRVPQDFIYLGRSVSILAGMCTALDPEYNPWNEIQGYMQPLLTGENGLLNEMGGTSALAAPFMEMISNSAGELFGVVEQTFVPQNTRARQLLEDIAGGELEVIARRSPQHRRQIERMEAQNIRMTRAVLFGSFLIAASVLHTGGETSIAAAGYVLALLSFISMMTVRA